MDECIWIGLPSGRVKCRECHAIRNAPRRRQCDEQHGYGALELSNGRWSCLACGWSIKSDDPVKHECMHGKVGLGDLVTVAIKQVLFWLGLTIKPCTPCNNRRITLNWFGWRIMQWLRWVLSSPRKILELFRYRY